jgi:uncharacterized protein with HEPN domain
MRREHLLLREMRDAAVAIRELVGDRSAEQVEVDALRRSALLVALHSPGRGRQPGPPPATRLRNRIVHGYWDIDVKTLVATAADDLPQMIAQLEGVITTLQQPDSDPPA